MGERRTLRKRTCECEAVQPLIPGLVPTNPFFDPRPMKKHRFSEDHLPSLFDSLSEELLFLILDRLESSPFDKKSFSLVCKSFYAVESRHRRIIRPLRSDLVRAVLSRYVSVSHLDLSFCPRVSDAIIALIATTVGSSLISIDLSRSRSFSHSGLAALAASCASLTEINLSNVIDLNDASAAAIGRARNLERLWLGRCKLVTDMGIGCIAVGCPKLRFLCLKWCLGLTDLGIGLVAAKCREIRNLDLSFTMVTKKCLRAILQLGFLEELCLVGCPGIDDEALASFMQVCKSLEVLNMSNCQRVSDVGFSSIVNGAVNLRQLMLAYYSPVTQSLASSLLKLAKLEKIKFDGCQITSSGLLALGNSCNSLKELSLSKCTGVTDEGLSSLVMKHKSLTKLDITCCRKITEISIASIARSCSSLTSLRMESCNLVSKDAFCLIGECCLLEELDLTDNDLDNQGLKAISKCHKLSILKIGLCLNVNDEGIIQIGKNCPLLEELDLYRSVGITDMGIRTVAQGCPILQMINLAYCTEITDNALLSLSKCSKLKTLELRGCSQVSNYGLAAIATGCKEIVKLDVKKCYDITDVGMFPLANLCCRLRQINLSYSSVTEIGLLALASISCLQSMTILHLSGLTPSGLATALLAFDGLTKVKLHMSFKALISKVLIEHLESRGCILQWRDKPFQAEVDANEVWKQRSHDLAAVGGF